MLSRNTYNQQEGERPRLHREELSLVVNRIVSITKLALYILNSRTRQQESEVRYPIPLFRLRPRNRFHACG